MPCFVAGWNFQPRTADTTTSSTAFPPDSTTVTSCTSPVSVTTKRTRTDTRSPDFSARRRSEGYDGELPESFLARVSTSPGLFS